MSNSPGFSLPPPPAGLNLSETRVPEMYGVLISTWALAAVTLGLRASVSRSRGGRTWWDDILAWMALVAATIQVLIVIGFMIPTGTGMHVWAGKAHSPRSWAIGLFISELAYVLVLALVKYSTLCLYWRLFSAEKDNRIPIWITAGLVTCWAVGTAVTGILQCFPVHAFWERFNILDPMPLGSFVCRIDPKKFFIGSAIPTVCMNVILLAMPVPYVWRLRMPTPQKIAVLGVFLLGAVLTIVSAVRLIVIINVDLGNVDMTWYIADSIIWSNLECNIAIFCCCLPTLKPLLDLFTAGTTKAASRVAARTATRGTRRTGGAGTARTRYGSTAHVQTLQSTCRNNEIPQWLEDSRCPSQQQLYEPGSADAPPSNCRIMTEIRAHRRPPPAAHQSQGAGGLRRMGSSPAGGSTTLSRSRSLSRARLAKSRVSSEDEGGAVSDVSSIGDFSGIKVTYDVVVSSERAPGAMEVSPQLDQLRFSEVGYPMVKF